MSTAVQKSDSVPVGFFLIVCIQHDSFLLTVFIQSKSFLMDYK